MMPQRKDPTAAPRSPSILVVDDDRRVRELLEIALTAHGFGVLTASDGDEGIKQALSQRPDLVVLDVRLPKRNGLEVCEVLRADPDDPGVPIVMVSAAAETEARLQGFARGADDYIAKPFSPKELVARIKRLLARHAESRTATQRALEMERDLSRALEEARRAHVDSRREQRLRELSAELGRDLLGTPDVDAVTRRTLKAVQERLGVGAVTLLAPARAGGELEPIAVRGDAFERVAEIEIRRSGELAQVLAGLGRPVLRAELEAMPELQDELAPFHAARFTLLAALSSPDGLEAVLAMEERADAKAITRADVETLKEICEVAVVALRNGRRFREQADRLLEAAAEQARDGSRGEAAVAEAAAMVDRAARATFVPPRPRELLRQGLALGPWALGPDGRRALERMRGVDPTGRIAELQALLDRMWNAADQEADADPDQRRAASLLRVGILFAEARARGTGIEAAMEHVLDRCGPALDPATRRALGEAAREAMRLEGDAA